MTRTLAPPFPRIPLVSAHAAADADDVFVSPGTLRASYDSDWILEEKCDGFNVSFELDDAGWPRARARSGKESGDRGGQLGPVRAWLGASGGGALRDVLLLWPVVYGEWMRRMHSIQYDALPDWLIVLDLWHPERGFAPTDVRDALCEALGLAHVPCVYRGPWPPESVRVGLCSKSRFSSGAAEGLVFRDPSRPERGAIAKWLAPGFVRRSDRDWGWRDNALALR